MLIVRKLPNGKLEIIVDADQAFEEWLNSLEVGITTTCERPGPDILCVDGSSVRVRPTDLATWIPFFIELR
jgi:hypothetical protein